jgi:hypothetical protein
MTTPPSQARGGFRGSRYIRGYNRGGRGRNGGNYYHNSGCPQRGARANMIVTEVGQSIVTQNQGSVTEGEVNKGEQQGETTFGQFAHFVYTKGNTENVSLAVPTLDFEWV